MKNLILIFVMFTFAMGSAAAQGCPHAAAKAAANKTCTKSKTACTKSKTATAAATATPVSGTTATTTKSCCKSKAGKTCSKATAGKACSGAKTATKAKVVAQPKKVDNTSAAVPVSKAAVMAERTEAKNKMTVKQ